MLLGLRAAHKSFAGDRDVIGGHIECGESAWSALCRELMEEVGVECVEGKHLDTITIAEPPRTLVLHLYSVTSWKGEPLVRNDEHSEVRWFGLDAAGLLPNLATQQYRAIFDALRRSKVG